MADQEHNNEGAAERPTLASPASAPPPSDTLAAPDGSGDRLSLSGFPVSVEADSAKNTNDFRSLPADPTPAATVPPPLPQLPGFALLDTLGRGGMGVVYKAQQLGLNRLVALKMVLAGAHASAEMLQRFKTEAAAIAQLQHPHIVQVYEIGEQEGLPYFAMEYVGGGSLDKLLAGTPQQPRDAALFVALLADAMELAHSKGIVHRDLKPANILLQRKNEECRMKNESNSSATFDIRHSKLGIPKITDFGLAKSLDADSAQTKSGMIMGTPSYMAPEQAAAKLHLVGPAADVYALGAILYEMLTGRPPFKAATALDTVMQVIHEEAVAPCKLQPRTPKDVETICLKCLRKDPARRYASAAALADDLRAFGEGRPIAARPVSRVERAWRWSKRNPAVAGLLATLACVVTAAFAVVFLLWLNAKEQRDLAQHERQKAEAHAALALHHLRTAEAQSEAARTEAAKSKKVADVMVGMFQAADPFGINGVLFIPKIMGEELTVRELLHRGAERMAKDLKDQPAVQAAVLDAIGQVYVTLGRMPEAAPLLEQAFHLRRQHLGEAHLDTATSRVNLGWLLHQQGEYLKAEQHYRAALALREKLQAAPELVDAARFRLAWLLTEMQEHAEAKQLGEQIIAFRRQHFGEKHRETAIAYLCMAGLYLEAGETAAAVPLSLKAMGIFLEVEGSASLSQAFAAFQNGWFAYNLGNYDKAEKDWRQSLQLLQTAVGAKHPAALLVLHEVGRVCEAKGKDQEAEQCYRECLDGARASFGIAHPKVTVLIDSYACLLERLGKRPEGIKLFEEHVEALRQRFGAHKLVAAALIRFSRFLDEQESPRQEALLREAIARCRERQQTRNDVYAFALNDLALCLARQNHPAEAESLLREALPIILAHAGPKHVDTATIKLHLGCLLVTRRNFQAETETLLRDALGYYRSQAANYPVRLKQLYRELNLLYRSTQRPDEAAAVSLERARAFANDPDQLYFVAMELAMCLPLLEQHRAWTPAQKRQKRQDYLTQSLATLQQAAAKGFHHPAWLHRDAAWFAPLQDRSEYQQFVQAVAKNAQSKK